MTSEQRMLWQRVEFLLANGPTIMYAFDPSPPHRATFVAPGIEGQLGYRPAECLADPEFWLPRVHPDDLHIVLPRFGLLRRRDHQLCEYRFRHRDGSYRWLRDEWRVVRDGPSPVEVVGLWTDITGRRLAEEAHPTSQERYHELFDDDLAGIFISSIGGRLLACNAAYAQMFGFASVEAALASNVKDRFENGVERQALLQLVTERKRLDSYRIRLRRADGASVHVVANLVGLFAADGHLSGLRGYLFDDSARAGTEAALRSTEQRYLDLFENANDIIFTTDLELRFTAVNAAAAGLSGYDRHEVLELRVDDMLRPTDAARIHQVRDELLRGAGPRTIEVEIVAKDGRQVPLEVSTRLTTHEGKPIGFQAIARDVSHRRLLEAQVRQAQKMEAIGRLAGGVAHDFNNLLTVISGYAEMLASALPPGSEGASDLAQIREASRRAADLTRQLLAFSRRQILSPKVIDLNDVVAAMHKMLGRLLGEDIEVRVTAAPGRHHVMVDPGQIEQVLMNLVVNARDAMPRGGRLTIETSHAIVDDSYVRAHPGMRAGAFAVLAVSDTGGGMDAATQARIFEPFFTTKEEGKGTGLGLSTVYGIVKQSGGYIWVYSEPGAGTVFKVYLPLRDEDVQPADTAERPRHAATGDETILLVEDDAHVRHYTARVLEDSGYRVLLAPNPAQALRVAADHGGAIDLLLTDVVMPGSDGRTLADRLCGDRPALRVLYMSGYTNEAIVNHGVLDASVKFIAKPFNAVDLLAKVRDALAG